MTTVSPISPLVDIEKPAYRAYRLKGAELRDNEDGGLRFQGEVAVFQAPSEDLGGFTEVIDHGAFRKVLNQDPDVRLLINHDPNLLLARTTSGTLQLRESGSGLQANAELAPTSYANDLRVLVGRGDMSQMSFGFSVGEDTWEERDDGTVLRTIHSFRDLFDVSVVTFPAYPQTNVSMRAISAAIRDALKDATDEEPQTSQFRLAARRRRLRLIEKRQATTEIDAVEDEQGSLNLGQANDALESIQAVIEDMEETLEAAGYPDPDDPPGIEEDEADEPEQPLTADEALKALQTAIEQIEDILETAGFPDPDND